MAPMAKTTLDIDKINPNFEYDPSEWSLIAKTIPIDPMTKAKRCKNGMPM